MSTPGYISIIGSIQGNITENAFTEASVGTAFVKGHENEIIVQEVKHRVTTPTDPQSGQPTGPRVHKPFIFTSALNKSTPLLYQALSTGEKLKTVEVKWYRTAANGNQEHFFTTKLEDAIIVDINLVMPHAQDDKFKDYTQLVEVSMSYLKINWTHAVAGTETSDSWKEPK